jgi:hypothetical protein
VHAEKTEDPEKVTEKGGMGLLLAHVVSCMKLIMEFCGPAKFAGSAEMNCYLNFLLHSEQLL